MAHETPYYYISYTLYYISSREVSYTTCRIWTDTCSRHRFPHLGCACFRNVQPPITFDSPCPSSPLNPRPLRIHTCPPFARSLILTLQSSHFTQHIRSPCRPINRLPHGTTRSNRSSSTSSINSAIPTLSTPPPSRARPLLSLHPPISTSLKLTAPRQNKTISGSSPSESGSKTSSPTISPSSADEPRRSTTALIIQAVVQGEWVCRATRFRASKSRGER